MKEEQKMEKDNVIIYKILRPIFTFIFKKYYNPTIINKEYIPKKGAAVIAGNHKHALDPILVDVCTKRVVHTLAKKDLHDGKFGWFFKAIGTIPVDLKEKYNKQSLTTAIEYLKENSLINVSPEAKRNNTKEILLPFKEQLYEVADKFKKLNFQFVANDDYKNTNYIVSMNNANEYLDDDVLLLHGDLVFNKNLIVKLLNNKNKSVCLYNEEKKLPKKDFKGRFKDNKLLEVSINIFDNDCYAFQPLYKLDKQDLQLWKEKVTEFVKNGNVKVYAENALNEIIDKLNIVGMSYKDDYIDEIDNEEDYKRVSIEIKNFD